MCLSVCTQWSDGDTLHFLLMLPFSYGLLLGKLQIIHVGSDSKLQGYQKSQVLKCISVT